MWTLCSSLKNRPAVPLLRRHLSYPLCPPYPPFLDWIAPFWRWPTQTAPAASCLRCDQSGAAVNCGARVLSSLPLSFCSTFICFCTTSLVVCHWDRGSATFREFWMGQKCWFHKCVCLLSSEDMFCFLLLTHSTSTCFVALLWVWVLRARPCFFFNGICG